MLGLLLRIYWTAFGNLPVFFIPIMKIKSRDASFTGLDAWFAAAVVALAVARVLDARFCNPVPSSSVRNYLMGLLAVSVSMAGLAHLFAYLLS